MSSKNKKKSVSQIVTEIQERSGIVGRTKELRQIVLARMSGRHVVIEGTVGVGKTTLAQAVADYFDQGFIRIDGDERYTDTRWQRSICGLRNIVNYKRAAVLFKGSTGSPVVEPLVILI